MLQDLVCVVDSPEDAAPGSVKAVPAVDLLATVIKIVIDLVTAVQTLVKLAVSLVRKLL